jgi:hypothetical protein
MIEPHSAQLGASSWILNATFVVPSDRVTVAGLPLPFAVGCRSWPCRVTVGVAVRRDDVQFRRRRG